jgi:hypothetical protein
LSSLVDNRKGKKELMGSYLWAGKTKWLYTVDMQRKKSMVGRKLKGNKLPMYWSLRQ